MLYTRKLAMDGVNTFSAEKALGIDDTQLRAQGHWDLFPGQRHKIRFSLGKLLDSTRTENKTGSGYVPPVKTRLMHRASALPAFLLTATREEYQKA